MPGARSEVAAEQVVGRDRVSALARLRAAARGGLEAGRDGEAGQEEEEGDEDRGRDAALRGRARVRSGLSIDCMSASLSREGNVRKSAGGPAAATATGPGADRDGVSRPSTRRRTVSVKSTVSFFLGNAGHFAAVATLAPSALLPSRLVTVLANRYSGPCVLLSPAGASEVALIALQHVGTAAVPPLTVNPSRRLAVALLLSSVLPGPVTLKLPAISMPAPVAPLARTPRSS